MAGTEIQDTLRGAAKTLAQEIAQRVTDINGTPPSAMFLAGGGSKLLGLRERLHRRTQGVALCPRKVRRWPSTVTLSVLPVRPTRSEEQLRHQRLLPGVRAE